MPSLEDILFFANLCSHTTETNPQIRPFHPIHFKIRASRLFCLFLYVIFTDRTFHPVSLHNKMESNHGGKTCFSNIRYSALQDSR